MKTLFFIILLMLISIFSVAQSDSLIYESIENNDSLIHQRLEEIRVYPKVGKKMNTRRYSRMIKKIKKVYPFAKQAAIELNVYNEKFMNIENERTKRKYVKQVEKELLDKYGETFNHFTISEGRYLMLLIDRETNETSYELIKELKGSMPAFFWQGIARIFGNNLKEEYDPLYKHFVIERIVQMIEQGQL